MKTTRREFLTTSVAAGLVAAAPAVHARAKAVASYRTALVGSGWWGTNILREAIRSGECSVVGLCDVDSSQLEKCSSEVAQLTTDSPKKYKDFRELLEKEKPEIVIVGTPDHWHPLVTIAAVSAGAHVYVEKPIGHTVYEGKAMVKAARDHNRVVQVGTHRRVSPHNLSGIKFLHENRAGKIGMVRAFVPSGTRPVARSKDAEPPAGLDWDMWCGPAPKRPFNPDIHPKGFRYFMDFANGQIGDWGIHWMDQILQWTEEKAPRRISSTGGRFIINDNTDASDTQVATFEFESFTACWEHHLYGGNEAEKHRLGAYFYGTKGTFHMGWLDGWTFYPVDTKKATIHEDAVLHEPDNQNIRELFANFLSAIKSGERPVCDIEIGHRSTNMSLLGNLSMKLGRSIAWDADKQVIPGDEEANALLKRPYREPWVYPKS